MFPFLNWKIIDTHHAQNTENETKWKTEQFELTLTHERTNKQKSEQHVYWKSMQKGIHLEIKKSRLSKTKISNQKRWNEMKSNVDVKVKISLEIMNIATFSTNHVVQELRL